MSEIVRKAKEACLVRSSGSAFGYNCSCGSAFAYRPRPHCICNLCRKSNTTAEKWYICSNCDFDICNACARTLKSSGAKAVAEEKAKKNETRKVKSARIGRKACFEMVKSARQDVPSLFALMAAFRQQTQDIETGMEVAPAPLWNFAKTEETTTKRPLSAKPAAPSFELLWCVAATSSAALEQSVNGGGGAPTDAGEGSGSEDSD